MIHMLNLYAVTKYQKYSQYNMKFIVRDILIIIPFIYIYIYWMIKAVHKWVTYGRIECVTRHDEGRTNFELLIIVDLRKINFLK